MDTALPIKREMTPFTRNLYIILGTPQLLIASWGFLTAVWTGEPMAKPETYGHVVYELSAEFWYFIPVLLATLMLFGVITSRGIDWRPGRWCRQIGGWSLVVFYAGLTWLSIQGGDGSILSLHGLLVGTLFAIVASLDIADAWASER